MTAMASSETYKYDLDFPLSHESFYQLVIIVSGFYNLEGLVGVILGLIVMLLLIVKMVMFVQIHMNFLQIFLILLQF